VQAAHDGAFGALHDTADIVVGESFDLAKKYDGFVIGVNSLIACRTRSPSSRERVWWYGSLRSLIGQRRLEILAAARAVGKETVPCRLSRRRSRCPGLHDAVQPCVEARLTLNRSRFSYALTKRFLRQLQGIVAIVDHAHRHGEDLALVPFN
jgi:hypothetical protein